MGALNRLEPDPGHGLRGLVRIVLPALLLVSAMSPAGGAETLLQPALAQSLPEAATQTVPDGFEVYDVSEYREGAADVLRVEYLGPGVRNEITYSTFGDAEEAARYLRGLDPNTCTVRLRSVCADQVASTIVSAASASTCPHPTDEVRHRALTLLAFGRSLLEQSSPAA